MELTIKQTKALDILEDDITTELLFGGGAGGAKSVLGCYWQIKNRLKYPGSRGLIGRTVLKTLKETTLKTFFDVCKMQGLKTGVHYSYSEQRGLISFSNGSEILLKDLASKPGDKDFDELGSLEITDAFIDEANQITWKAKDIVSSRIRYKLDEFGLIPKILMTCNPAKNWTYSEFYRLDKDKKLPSYRKFLQSLATDNPFLTHHYIDNLRKLDKNSRERLLYGNWEFDDDPYSLIESYDAIIDLFSNKVQEGKMYIVCDAARFGSDKAVIIVFNGMKAIDKFTFDKSKTTDISKKITEFQEMYGIPNRQTLVDSDGVGGGVADEVGCVSFVNNARPKLSKDKRNFDNLKSQCAFMLADMVNGSQLSIEFKCNRDERDEIIQEFEQLKREPSDEKMKMISKDKIKENIGRSPDWLDTFIMRMYFELNSSGFAG
jgi:phage terminase large subunit